MSDLVDGYRFVSGITRRVVKSWAARQPPREIPWTPLRKPLFESRVALVSSGGVALKEDKPFDQDGERANPWWGDTSYRVIPRHTATGDVEIYHLHINPSYAREDLNCLLPLERLAELEAEGVIGESAPRHYSFMGYTPQPEKLLEESVPAMIQSMKEDAVDAVILVPA